MPDPKYKELETTDDVQDGYEAQNTIEDKFYYLLNYSARNALIRQSADFLSEKERLSMGMKPARFTNTKNFDMEKACSKFQNNTEMLVDMGKRYDEKDLLAYKRGKNEPCTEGSGC